MDSKKIIYSLVEADIQTVALQEIERKLTHREIEKIEKLIAEKIEWYDVIADSISESIKE